MLLCLYLLQTKARDVSSEALKWPVWTECDLNRKNSGVRSRSGGNGVRKIGIGSKTPSSKMMYRELSGINVIF